MRTRILSLALTILLLLPLAACGQGSQPTWQERYSAGVRFLADGDCREAVAAFQEAIALEPQRADAYISLANTYAAMGDADAAAQVLAEALAAVKDAEGQAAIRARLGETA